MRLFKKKSAPAPVNPFPADQYEPVLRSSICTGERTACMRNRETGKIHEIMVIRSPKDLSDFGREYGVDTDKIQTVY